jgi:hypothetical protein
MSEIRDNSCDNLVSKDLAFPHGREENADVPSVPEQEQLSEAASRLDRLRYHGAPCHLQVAPPPGRPAQDLKAHLAVPSMPPTARA